ncbi:MAG: FtsW/RodA/SpoVE family cell cycle protein [Oscillospiraceae bacterium]|nr:FtsW/RodA/SpoVE family cell cycle protein [Oscillospiraceae bacterium]
MKNILYKIKNLINETDFILMLLCIATSIFGITMVFSATRATIPEGGFISRDARTMILAVALGLAIAIAVSFIDYNFITKMFPFIGAVCILLMLSLFIWGKGPAERPDAKTWLSLGNSGLYFQPSELLKIGFIITFGMHIELVSDKITKFFHVLLLCVHAAVPIGLVALTGDMGSALVFLIIFIVMMFCAGVQLRYFAIGAAAAVAAIPAVWYFVFDTTQKSRILGLIYPDRYTDVMFQQNQGMKAIISGGLTGQGLFNGNLTQVENAIPEAENDMIFTCIGEELGIIGCAAALMLLLGIIIKIMLVGHKSRYGATKLMCYGMAAMIGSQTIINIGMCLKLLPVIGITLPFFSAGGSSNLCVYIGIGLILSVYRFDKDKDAISYKLSNSRPFSTY